MKKSPKIVQVTLQTSSKYRKDSPKYYLEKSTNKQSDSQQLEFSFQKKHLLKTPQKNSRSHSKKYNTSPSKKWNKKQTYGINSERYKNDKDPRDEDRQFKKSIEKLKKSFFNKPNGNKQYTVKTLKQIGKYAQERNKRTKQKKQKLKNSPPKEQIHDIQYLKRQKIPVQIKQNSCYLDFEHEYKHYLKSGQRSNPTPELKIFSEQFTPRISNNFHEQRQNFEQDLTSQQIQVICEIFHTCQKLTQSDTITLKDFYFMMQQFQRQYFIRQIQQNSFDSQKNNENNNLKEAYYDILDKFQQHFKIIFYRQQQNDIYDALYHLQEANKLEKVCKYFKKIKEIHQF